MNTARRTAATAALVLAGLAALPAAGDTDLSWWPLARIRAGMEGYGLTVFSGSRVDTFGVRVVGVQEGTRPGGGMILVELSGHDLEDASIPQGMSGSPVYLEGRFAGAVAIGWSGALKPLAGLTPADDILGLPREAEPALDGAADSRPGPAAGLRQLLAARDEGRDLAAALWPEAAGRRDRAGDAAPGLPAGWPGPAELGLALLSDLAAPDGRGPASAFPPGSLFCRPIGAAVAGAAAGDGGAPPTLAAGAACGVPLVMGDATLGAVGTATLVDDGHVVLLGHPFLMRGPVALPLATAEILAVMPTRQMSFKFGELGPVVGTVHHDLRAGLAGRLGEPPRLVPVRADVARGGGRSGFSFEVASDPMLTPSLVFWCLYNSVLAGGDDLSLQTVSYEVVSRWTLNGEPLQAPVRLSGTVAGPGSIGELAQEWMAPLAILAGSAHARLELTGVEAELAFSYPMRTARIAALAMPATATSGAVLPLTVDLAPRRGEPRAVDLELAIPSHLPAGLYRVAVANAREFFALEAERAQDRFADRDLAVTLDLLRQPRAENELVAMLIQLERGFLVEGRELPALPPSVHDLFARDESGRVSPTLATEAVAVRRLTEFVLSGHVVQDLLVRPASQPHAKEKRP